MEEMDFLICKTSSTVSLEIEVLLEFLKTLFMKASLPKKRFLQTKIKMVASKLSLVLQHSRTLGSCNLVYSILTFACVERVSLSKSQQKQKQKQKQKQNMHELI